MVTVEIMEVQVEQPIDKQTENEEIKSSEEIADAQIIEGEVEENKEKQSENDDMKSSVEPAQLSSALEDPLLEQNYSLLTDDNSVLESETSVVNLNYTDDMKEIPVEVKNIDEDIKTREEPVAMETGMVISL